MAGMERTVPHEEALEETMAAVDAITTLTEPNGVVQDMPEN